MEWTLPARVPFSLDAVVRSHGWAQLAPFRRKEGIAGLGRVERLASGRVVDLRLGEAPDGVRVAVEAPLTDAEQVEVTEKVGWMLALDQEFEAFYALVQQEPKLAHMEAKAQGRLLRSPTLFEDVVKTILTTNTAWGGTKRMVQALVSNFGSALADDEDRRTFPGPEQLAVLDEADLRTTGGLGYRAPYVLALARTVASGDLDLEGLRRSELPAAELRKELLALKGVGAYAAANLLMILGRYDFLPVDSWALKLVSHEWYEGEPVGAEEVEAAFADWGTWRGLAYWFWDWSYTG